MNLPAEFLARMRERLGETFPAFLSSYEVPPWRALRVNTLKVSREEFLRVSPFALEPVPWAQNGFYLEAEKAGSDPYHFAGLYYVQEPSAMCVGELTAPCKKERVLDLCAAPGGKTTLIAAQMRGEGILIANEIDFGRAVILSQNVERLGIKNCAVVSTDPETLAQQFPEYFDLVLVDAPCSGEGMFKKEPEALPHWSPNNVAMCAARQRDILEEAAKTVAGGGHLIYSTCTFAEEEDEWQIRAFLERHPEFVLEQEEKLYPHKYKGEGHYCARLKKIEGERRRGKSYPIERSTQANKAFYAFAEDFFTEVPKSEIAAPWPCRGRMYLVPAGMPALNMMSRLRLGVELGEFDGRVFKPAHALAMATKREECRRFVSLTREECLRYLRGETLEREIENGWCVVGVEDYPLGLGKVVNGVMKNHLPKGLRKR
ncbi:MAG: RsmF rRNA methyltransferase first C-terminal domain-containing protein [Clostridia bacterium]|nr:RsmF rRNA methyltransferase first C-terminal domain-containing protein [Clostridia bacterium]